MLEPSFILDEDDGGGRSKRIRELKCRPAGLVDRLDLFSENGDVAVGVHWSHPKIQRRRLVSSQTI